MQLTCRALEEQKGREVATAQFEMTKNLRKEMQGMQETFHAQCGSKWRACKERLS
jgi:hypothetical protein